MLAVVDHRAKDAFVRHELIAVTLFDTDCNDALAIQSCTVVFCRQELILVMLAVVDHRTKDTFVRHELIAVTLFDTDCNYRGVSISAIF